MLNKYVIKTFLITTISIFISFFCKKLNFYNDIILNFHITLIVIVYLINAIRYLIDSKSKKICIFLPVSIFFVFIAYFFVNATVGDVTYFMMLLSVVLIIPSFIIGCVIDVLIKISHNIKVSFENESDIVKKYSLLNLVSNLYITSVVCVFVYRSLNWGMYGEFYPSVILGTFHYILFTLYIFIPCIIYKVNKLIVNNSNTKNLE